MDNFYLVKIGLAYPVERENLSVPTILNLPYADTLKSKGHVLKKILFKLTRRIYFFNF